MLLKTILNTVEKHKSFVDSDARWSKRMPGREIEFEVQPRKNSKPICSGCGRKRPGYDCQVARRFEFVPLWAGVKRGQASLMFYRIYITYIPDTRLCSRSRGWLEPPWRTSRRGTLDEVPVVAELPVWLDEQPCLHR